MAEKPKQVVYEFRVCYTGNPEYTGDWHPNLVEGIHGKFKNLKIAQEHVERCKKYFTHETIMTRKPDKNDGGKIKDIVKTIVHDNVKVWIETYKDGILQDDEPEQEAEKKGKRVKEGAAA